jgi:hypothetical protein
LETSRSYRRRYIHSSPILTTALLKIEKCGKSICYYATVRFRLMKNSIRQKLHRTTFCLIPYNGVCNPDQSWSITASGEACSDNTNVTTITVLRLPHYSPQQTSRFCSNSKKFAKQTSLFWNCMSWDIYIIFLRGLQNSLHYKKEKVKQSRYRPGVAQRVPGS